MSANAGYATLSIIPSAKGFGSALGGEVLGPLRSVGDQGGSEAGNSFASKFKALAVAAVTAGATKAVVGFTKEAIMAAGDLEQSMGAIDGIFKGSAGQMHQWASTAAQDVGLTANEFNELGTLIGAQLKNGGTAMEELAPKTNELIGLGADMAAMFGGTTKEAVEAISSALKGERDPIEKYGVSLKQAQIDAKAAELGFEKVGGQLTQEATQAATLALIMEQTSDAHGQFGREADTLQGQLSRLKAGWGEVKTGIGELFLPAATAAIGKLNEMVEPFHQAFAAMREGKDATDALSSAFVDMGAKLFGSGFRVAFSELTSGTHELSPHIEQLMSSFSGLVPAVMGVMSAFNPLSLVFKSLLPLLPQILAPLMDIASALAVALTDACNAFAPVLQSLISTLTESFAAILPGIISIIQMLAGAFINLLPVVTPIITQIATLAGHLIEALMPCITTLVNEVLPPVISIITTIIDTIMPLIGLLADLLIPAIDALLPVVSTVFNAIAGIIGGAMQTIQGIIQVVMGILQGDWSMAWEGIKNIVGGIWEMITSLIDGAIHAIWDIIVAVGNIIANTWNTMWQGIFDFLSDIWNSISGFVQDSWNNVCTFMSDIGNNISDNWNAMWEGAKNFVSDTWDNICSGIGGWVDDVWNSINDGINRYQEVWNRGWEIIGNFVNDAWNNITSAVSDGIDNAVNFIRDLPQKAMDALGDIGHTLFESGKALIQGFIDGIGDMANNIGEAVGDMLEGVRDFFPFSPAKKGPFSGLGYTTHSGRALASDFAAGIRSGQIAVAQAANVLTGAASDAIAGMETAGGLTGAVSGADAEQWAAMGMVVADGMTTITETITTSMSNLQLVWGTIWDAIALKLVTVWDAMKVSVAEAMTIVNDTFTASMVTLEAFMIETLNRVGEFWLIRWTQMYQNCCAALANTINQCIIPDLQLIELWVTTIMNQVGVFWMNWWNNTMVFTQNTMNTIAANIASAMANILQNISAYMSTIQGVWTVGWNAVHNVVADAWNQATEACRIGMNNVITVIRELPGNIRGAIGDVGSTLKASGESMMNGFIEGIRAAGDRVGDAVGAAMAGGADYLPHSPAKKGPLSGHGYTTYSGRALMTDFAKSIDHHAPKLALAAREAAAEAEAALIPETPTLSAPKVGGGVVGALKGYSDQRPLVENLTFQSSGNLKDDLNETMFQLRRITRGGAHA